MLSTAEAIVFGATHKATSAPWLGLYYKFEEGLWHCTECGVWCKGSMADSGPEARARLGLEPISLEALMDEFIKGEIDNGK